MYSTLQLVSTRKETAEEDDSPVCRCALFLSDDMWSQRTVTKWPESGVGSHPVSSALLVSHCQTGSECWSLSTEGQQH